MSAPLRLVLARHGQTPANVTGTLDTLLPGPGLTDLGREQAAALARDLADGVEGPVAAVYHSPARRAELTAGIVAGALDLSPRPVDGTYEVQAGDLEGSNDERDVEVFRSTFDAWQHGELDLRMPGGESGRDVVARLRGAIASLRARHDDGGTLVLVSHGAAVRLAVTDLLGDRVPDADEIHLANCGRVVLERIGAGDGEHDAWRLVAWRIEVPGGLPSSRDVTG